MRLTRRSLASLVVGGLVLGGISLTVAPSAQGADLAAAVARADAYASSRGSTVGISVVDRDTGQYYENGGLAHTQMRSASVLKIFVAESLLDRSRRGEISLSQADRDLVWTMITRSDDAAMSNLYSRFGGQGMVMGVAAEYGLAEIGIPPTPGYWGMYRITAHDIAAFYLKVIEATHLHPADRDQLVTMMRSATHHGSDGFDQYFGIPYALPYQYWGVKQGWMCCQEGLRRLHTSGILGQDSRYAVAVVGQMPQSLSYAHAAQTLTGVVQILYPGGGIPPSERVRVPFGSVDVTREQGPGLFRLAGWTADPDEPTRSLDVHVYVDGVLAAYGPAAADRADVAAVLAGYGPAHGYDLLVPVPDGRHEICVYAINVGPGLRNPALGCSAVETRLSPVGNFELAVAVGLRGMQVSGWTMDPESPATSTEVRLVVDGRPAPTVTAGGSRPDVGGAFPGAGAAHGFSASLGMAWPGRHEICAYAVNVAGTGGADALLTCRTVVGPTGLLGQFDAVTAAPGAVRVAGWAVDALVPGQAVPVHVYVDGRFAGGTTTGTARPDVAALYPEGGPQRGFDATVAAAPGNHAVCVFALYTDQRAPNPGLACRTVTVP